MATPVLTTLGPFREGFMRRLFSAISFAILALAATGVASAEVKSVRMHIAGYLCGN
jgi:hypothetical protein